MSTPPTPIHGRPGALGLNVGWQDASPQTSPRPLVQIQGQGGDDLLSQSGYGVSSSRQASVDNDLITVGWMDGYLVDGEFPGNGDTTPGNNFFDMMNGMASMTRGWRALLQTQAWDSLYHAQLMAKIPTWTAVALWLTTPSVKTVGDGYNQNNTHRYWMSAAVLRNIAYLLRLQGGPDNVSLATTLEAIALDYETQALARQKGPGWMLALYPPFPSGKYRPGTLYNPTAGDPIPLYLDGTPSNAQISGEGVRPELGDTTPYQAWDAIYNPNGDKLAVFGIGVQPAGAHRDACIAAIDRNLLCAMQFLTAAKDNQGALVVISANASTRVGDLDINDNPKKVDPKAWRYIFQVMAGLAPDAANFGGSNDPVLRALFAQVYYWLDGAIRNPTVNLTAPPAIPASIYPTPAAPVLPAAPVAPLGLNLVAGNNSVSVDWNDGPAGCTSKVYRNGVLIASGLAVSQYNDATAVNGISYSYTVSYVDSFGQEGPQSPAKSATPVAPVIVVRPAAPLNGRIDVADGTATPHWDFVTGALSYSLYLHNLTTGTDTLIESGLAQPSDTFHSLPNNTAVAYRSSATNSAGEGLLSAVVTGTPNPAVPGAMGTVLASPGDGQIALIWQPLVGATLYRIQRDGADYATSATSSYTDIAAANNVSHAYMVAGANVAGTGPYSLPVSATAMAAVPPSATGGSLILLRKAS